jgi:hypothetical protein
MSRAGTAVALPFVSKSRVLHVIVSTNFPFDLTHTSQPSSIKRNSTDWHYRLTLIKIPTFPSWSLSPAQIKTSMRMNNTKLLSQTIREGRKGDRKSRFGQTSQEQDLPNKSYEKNVFF